VRVPRIDLRAAAAPGRPQVDQQADPVTGDDHVLDLLPELRPRLEKPAEELADLFTAMQDVAAWQLARLLPDGVRMECGDRSVGIALVQPVIGMTQVVDLGRGDGIRRLGRTGARGRWRI
jgi:hypothetical protein